MKRLNLLNTLPKSDTSLGSMTGPISLGLSVRIRSELTPLIEQASMFGRFQFFLKSDN